MDDKPEFQKRLEPELWLILFHRKASTWWINWLVPGQFKHVTAVGHVGEAGVWLVYSVELRRTRMHVIRDGDQFIAWLAAAIDDGEVLVYQPPADDGKGWRPRFGFWCVTAVKHLLGIGGGALRPDALWRLLLANGAKIIPDGEFHQSQPADGAQSV